MSRTPTIRYPINTIFHIETPKVTNVISGPITSHWADWCDVKVTSGQPRKWRHGIANFLCCLPLGFVNGLTDRRIFGPVLLLFIVVGCGKLPALDSPSESCYGQFGKCCFSPSNLLAHNEADNNPFLNLSAVTFRARHEMCMFSWCDRFFTKVNMHSKSRLRTNKHSQILIIMNLRGDLCW